MGILASCSAANNCLNLYFIDATGSYPVRAFAIGNQSIQVNRKLQSVDFTNYTKEEGVQKLLDLIATSSSETEQQRHEESSSSNNDRLIKPLPKHTVLEIATMDAKTGAFVRMRRQKNDESASQSIVSNSV